METPLRKGRKSISGGRISGNDAYGCPLPPPPVSASSSPHKHLPYLFLIPSRPHLSSFSRVAAGQEHPELCARRNKAIHEHSPWPGGERAASAPTGRGGHERRPRPGGVASASNRPGSTMVAVAPVSRHTQQPRAWGAPDRGPRRGRVRGGVVVNNLVFVFVMWILLFVS